MLIGHSKLLKLMLAVRSQDRIQHVWEENFQLMSISSGV